MPRKPRELADNGIYHIYNRSNNGMPIFCDDNDFHVFQNILFKAKQLYPCSIFHYCLMTTHFHFLAQTKTGHHLPKFMHKIQLAYALYFMKKYRYGGHVFQERYKSLIVSKESYLLQCGRYIERNPLKAEMVQKADAYAYSSARYYLRDAKISSSQPIPTT